MKKLILGIILISVGIGATYLSISRYTVSIPSFKMNLKQEIPAMIWDSEWDSGSWDSGWSKEEYVISKRFSVFPLDLEKILSHLSNLITIITGILVIFKLRE